MAGIVIDDYFVDINELLSVTTLVLFPKLSEQAGERYRLDIVLFSLVEVG